MTRPAGRRLCLVVVQSEGPGVPAVPGDGGGYSSNWSDRFNRAGDVAPVGGDDLVPPVGAARPTNFTNFPSGTPFHPRIFTGSGYAISGGPLYVPSLGSRIGINAVGAVNSYRFHVANRAIPTGPHTAGSSPSCSG